MRTHVITNNFVRDIISVLVYFGIDWHKILCLGICETTVEMLYHSFPALLALLWHLMETEVSGNEILNVLCNITSYKPHPKTWRGHHHSRKSDIYRQNLYYELILRWWNRSRVKRSLLTRKGWNVFVRPYPRKAWFRRRIKEEIDITHMEVKKFIPYLRWFYLW